MLFNQGTAKAKIKQWKLVPQPDITAYELAQLIPLIVPATRRPEHLAFMVEHLPDNVKRHLVEVEDGQ